MRGWSLGTKILLAVSISISLLVGATSWLALRFAVNTTSQALENEVRASLRAYETLWRARENMLAATSLLMSNMSDVRAAFRTGDQATILDTAAELWATVSREEAIFLVADRAGAVIASLGGGAAPPLKDAIEMARPLFPAQGKGFLSHGGQLWQIVVTPVYVDARQGSTLLNVLVAGYPVNRELASALRRTTGSEFLFSTGGKAIASTLGDPETSRLQRAASSAAGPALIEAGGEEFGLLAAPLLDVAGKPIGELRIVRSFDETRRKLEDLRRGMLGIWCLSVIVGLGLSYGLTRRIVKPIEELDRAAAEVARQNYDARLTIDRGDELGRLALSFNAMCVSVAEARADSIRQERLATIGQFATSIVHDLRNPLAAIYGGTEMLVDPGLSEAQSRRVARNMHQAARSIQALLQDLTNISKGKAEGLEECKLGEIIDAAIERLSATAEAQGVKLIVEVDRELEVLAERARMERVFFNLVSNSLEAIRGEGWIRVEARRESAEIVTRITDSGPGIAEQIRPHLFEPFATAGKRNGLGLGLALSRQIVRSHGGDLWAEATQPGACFCVRLNEKKVGAVALVT